MRNVATVVAAAFAGLVASSLTATAQTSLVGEFRDWGVYKNTQLQGNQCYALTVPTALFPTSVNHGDNFFMVSGANGKFSPQIVLGYQLKADSPVQVKIDGKRFAFFSEGNRAWASDASQEAAIIQAMRSGRGIEVDAVSARGTQTKYNFSLSGVSASLQRAAGC